MDGDRVDDGQPLDPNAPVPLFGDGADANNTMFHPPQQLGDNNAFPPHDPQMGAQPMAMGVAVDSSQAPIEMPAAEPEVKEDAPPPPPPPPPAQIPENNEPPKPVDPPTDNNHNAEAVPAAKTTTEEGFAVDEDAGLGVKIKPEESDLGSPKAPEPPQGGTITSEIGPGPDTVADDQKPSEDGKGKAEPYELPVVKAEGTMTTAPAEEKAEEDPTPKKRPAKPVKKVLVAKKESDIAMSFLTGKRDLADFLPEKDTLFLASEFWVFTLAQFDFLLDRATGKNTDESKAPTRDQILVKLEAAKEILLSTSPPATPPEQPKAEETAESKPDETAEGEKMDVDVDAKDESKEDGESKGNETTEEGAQPMETDDKPSEEPPAPATGDAGPSNNEPVVEATNQPDAAQVPTESTANQPDAAQAATETPTPVIPDDPESLRALAEAKIEQWQKLLEEAKTKPGRPIEEILPLDGPVKTLITSTVLNFLSSVKIKTLLSFMSLKKTETGSICEYFLTWRKKCGLAPVTPLGVAKYLLSINSRIETALAAVPPVEEEKRHWMMDPIIVMTGAAREFLIEDQKLLTAFDFVHTRTKDLSLALAAWRERKGFVPLKGSGKVAMISGWKATSKEALELESGVGRVLTSETDLEGLDLSEAHGAPLEFSPPPAKKRQMSNTPRSSVKMEEGDDETPLAIARPSRKSVGSPKDGTGSLRRPTSSSRKQSEYDLHSKLFLDEILGEEETDILGAVGLHTAAQLFEADEEWRTHLANEIREAQLATGTDEADKLIDLWISQLKKELGIKGEYRGQSPVKRKRKFDSTESSDRKGRSGPKPKKGSNSHPHHKIVTSATVANVSDPYELLSTVTKEFLATIGIETAEKFLSTRTTDIAAEFVIFRKRKGMSELKGLGSIASVSGWKANCRKFCKQMGMDDVAELEPPDKLTKGDGPPRAKKKKTEADNESDGEKSEDESPFSSQRIASQGLRKDSPLQFRFDLSLRRSSIDNSSEKQVFVSYKGSYPRTAQPMTVHSSDFVPFVVDGKIEKRLILRDALLTRVTSDRTVDIRVPFSSSKSGCGLVELSKFGVRNMDNQDLEVLKQRLASFVSSSPVDSELGGSHQTDSNVILRRTGVHSFQYLLNVEEPMQAGQTVSLCFPSIETALTSEQFSKSISPDRHRLVEALFILSKHDIQHVLAFLTELSKGIEIDSMLNEHTIDLKEKLPSVYVSRQRLSWLSRHIISLLPDSEIVDSLYFDGTMLPGGGNHIDLDPDALEAVKVSVSAECRAGLLSVLEFDAVCGVDQRSGWCALVRECFDAMIDVAAEYGEDYPDTVKTGFADMYGKISELSIDGSSMSKWLFKSSPLLSNEDGEKENVAVCRAEDKTVKSVVEDALEGEEVATDWYKMFMVQIQVKIARACEFLMKEKDFPISDVLQGLQPILGQEAFPLEYGLPATKAFPHKPPQSRTDLYRPQTLQFFLGIVWPVLREFGWRVEVVKYPSESKYIAPQWRGDQQKKGKLAKLAKQQRDRRRSELSRRVNQMGLGTLPKFTKRLLIASKDPGSASGKPVVDVVNAFLEATFESGSSSFDQAKEIIDLVLKCFDELASSLHDGEDSGSINVFIQFLLVLPSILTQSDLPLQEINDSLQVIQDLTSFCSEKADDIFASLPPDEHYGIEEKRPSSNLVERLGIAAGKIQAGEELTEVIWEEDKSALSDFVVTVMEQVIACRATEEDAKKKRRVQVGYPGAACRHCMGVGGEGRYFFTTIESLTTLGTVFEKHFAKCPSVPSEIKKAITSNKLRHHEQRKLLPAGSQQKYFLQLWDRLRTMRISNNEGGVVPITQVSPQKKEESVATEEIVHERKEFTDALEVLDYIRTTLPWKETKEIDSALNQYYTCVDFGGRIYNTSSMPKHFSPAWLLGKVGPKKRATRKTMLIG